MKESGNLNARDRRLLTKQKRTACRPFFIAFGDPSENRTPDTMIKSHVLYQLS